jgi:hypothetical protein
MAVRQLGLRSSQRAKRSRQVPGQMTFDSLTAYLHPQRGEDGIDRPLRAMLKFSAYRASEFA